MYTIKIAMKARVLYHLSRNRRLRQSNCLAHAVSISSFRTAKAYRFRGNFRENIEPSCARHIERAIERASAYLPYVQSQQKRAKMIVISVN